MKRLAIIVVVFWLAGCVGVSPDVQRWSRDTHAQAQAGKLKWSDYYKELFAKLSAERFPDKGGTLDRVNNLITVSLAYERGDVPKEAFESFQRNMLAQQEANNEAIRAAQGAAMGQALQNYGNTVYGPQATQNRMIPAPTYTPPPNLPPRQTNCQIMGNQVDCTSNR